LQDEISLVQRAQQRDSQAFAELYEAYFDKIYRYIAMRVRNEMEAEDLTQQVFMKMLQSITAYKSQGVPFSSWVYRIAHNQVVDFHRHQNKKSTVDIDGMPWLEAEDDPQKQLEQQFDIEELKAAMQQLTVAQQEVLTLRFTSDMPIAQCAEIMGKSEGAIKALQHSAVQALRKTLVGKNK
jgi:RNA polymerase sigma-70 factor (ECF subfamily)